MMTAEVLAASGGPASLVADCANCFGLCCVALPFLASSEFAVDKPAGTACVNLRSDSRCGIHDRLRDSGYQGCTVFDCNGAGQKVSQHTLGGVDWRTDAAASAMLLESFPVMRLLHELLAYLVEARVRLEAMRDTDAVPVNVPAKTAGLLGDVNRLLTETEHMTLLPAVRLRDVDAGSQRQLVSEVLLSVSELLRSTERGGARRPSGIADNGAPVDTRITHGKGNSRQAGAPDPATVRARTFDTLDDAARGNIEEASGDTPDGNGGQPRRKPTATAAKRAITLHTRGRGADLIGVDLAATDLRRVNLRGAYLIAANLRGADLRGADLIGVDLRDTDLRDADLSDALFVTQMQLNAARGNAATRIPGRLQRPAHWMPVAVTIEARRPSR
ncbi:pentapeptide repeat-containing protein [Lysinibacter cavernae]|uniref:Uncharacterized protein YjbI with pentapeptide repeats n=1 Tax=Lysinibacter cavernae TaxID=1640652 RepID=A0A7X5R0H4_9MICO|nr:pentapeptide repeat-containing protein [Lysinibacter cavernae]NIH53323.1 uncharacterized protein YjbI with pentapeptide repeats [Lysinibacter cavernae]